MRARAGMLSGIALFMTLVAVLVWPAGSVSAAIFTADSQTDAVGAVPVDGIRATDSLPSEGVKSFVDDHDGFW